MTNNFDLLRLIAALQVVYIHSVIHLDQDLGLIGRAFQYVIAPLPGVPVFFIISGFLISSSYERRRSRAQFAYNRVLRIFPALWVCLAVTIMLLAIAGFVLPTLTTPAFLLWTIAQSTMGQFYNLDEFRAFGVGVPNGSVWTISVELAFYAMIPLIYHFLVERRRRAWTNVSIVLICVLSFLVESITYRMDPTSTELWSKIIGQTPAPHLYLFLMGILAQRNYHSIKPWVEGRAFAWTILYFPLMYLLPSRTDAVLYDLAFLGLRVCLVGWLLAAAFSSPGLATRILRGNDMSYGIYLFHMLIINIIVQFFDTREPWMLPIVVLLAIICGFVSWSTIERPLLRRKKMPSFGARPGQSVAVPRSDV